MLENSPWDSEFGSIFKTRYNRDAIEKYKGDIEKSGLQKGWKKIAGTVGGGVLGNMVAPGIGGTVAGGLIGNSIADDEDDNKKSADGFTKEEVIDSNETVEPRTSSSPTQKSLKKAINSIDRFIAKARPKSIPKPKNINIKGASHG